MLVVRCTDVRLSSGSKDYYPMLKHGQATNCLSLPGDEQTRNDHFLVYLSWLILQRPNVDCGNIPGKESQGLPSKPVISAQVGETVT